MITIGGASGVITNASITVGSISGIQASSPVASSGSGDWILEDGTWDDSGTWIDTSTWNDGV